MFDLHDRTPKRPGTMEFHAHAVQRVIGAIRERLDENISLAEMASVAYMSRFHFNRTFRKVTGLPPRRFLSKLRVEAATRMLLNTDNSVTDICFDVGYSSLGTFIRRFSGVLGISPSKLRMLRHLPPKQLLESLEKDASLKVERQAGVAGQITGRVLTPPSFPGLIFVGLFPTPIPEGKPVACVVKLQPGEFTISAAPKGRYYLFALGLPWPESLDHFFHYEAALRGGGQLVTVNEFASECEEIHLRAAASTDPPVLLNLPFLLGKNRVAKDRVGKDRELRAA